MSMYDIHIQRLKQMSNIPFNQFVLPYDNGELCVCVCVCQLQTMAH